jgi:hypothetical protein
MLQNAIGFPPGFFVENSDCHEATRVWSRASVAAKYQKTASEAINNFGSGSA